MATGYTYKIGEGVSFNDFVMTCARAMGACVMMRDDSPDAPIPDKFEPSTHHAERLQESVDRLCEVNEIDHTHAWSQSLKNHKAEIQHAQKEIKKNQELKVKYEAMLAKVQAWEPPSSDHVEFKNFMIQQITDSIKWDCGDTFHQKRLARKPLSGKKYKQIMLDTAVNDIIYHNKENKAEIQRAEERTRWVNQLRDSLKTERVGC